VSIPDERMAALVKTWGVPLNRICLIAVDDDKPGCILLWRPTTGAKFTIIEPDTLDTACYVYLRRMGARRFATTVEAQVHARRERWLGWDR
jgi:hypothetical protein